MTCSMDILLIYFLSVIELRTLNKWENKVEHCTVNVAIPYTYTARIMYCGYIIQQISWELI